MSLRASDATLLHANENPTPDSAVLYVRGSNWQERLARNEEASQSDQMILNCSHIPHSRARVDSRPDAISIAFFYYQFRQRRKRKTQSRRKRKSGDIVKSISRDHHARDIGARMHLQERCSERSRTQTAIKCGKDEEC